MKSDIADAARYAREGGEVPKGFPNPPYSLASLAPHAANSPLDLSV